MRCRVARAQGRFGAPARSRANVCGGAAARGLAVSTVKRLFNVSTGLAIHSYMVYYPFTCLTALRVAFGWQCDPGSRGSLETPTVTACSASYNPVNASLARTLSKYVFVGSRVVSCRTHALRSSSHAGLQEPPQQQLGQPQQHGMPGCHGNPTEGKSAWRLAPRAFVRPAICQHPCSILDLLPRSLLSRSSRA